MAFSKGGDLWKPKKTLRDWGRTEYRIVRNWTPREVREARNNVPPPPSSLARVSQQVQQEEEEEKDNDSPLIKDQGAKQVSYQEGEVPLEVAVDEDPEPSLVSIQRWRDSQEASSSQVLTGDGSISKRAAKDTSQRSEAKTDGQRDRSSRSGAVGDSRIDDMSLLGEEEGYASSANSRAGGSLSVEGSQNQQEGEEPLVSEESQLSSEELQGPSRPADTLTPPSSSKPQGKKQKTTSSKGRKKTPTTAPITVKLWQPRHVKRTRRDLSELDVCLTLYDEVVREAIDVAGSLAMERMLVSHWKHTQKHMLSMIRDVHTVAALNKRLKQERAKHRILQKDHMIALKALRRTNGSYHETLGRAKRVQKMEELAVQTEEIERLTQELRPFTKQCHI